MVPINDIHGHLVCRANGETGQIENLYHKQRITAKIPIGGEILIRRRGTVTIVRRLPTGQFYTYSMIDPEPLDSRAQ